MVRFSSSGLSEREASLRGQDREGLAAGHQGRVELHGAHDRLEPLADVGGRCEPGRGLLLQAAQDDALELDRQTRGDLADRGRIGELDGANALKFRGVGPVEGVPPGGELVEDQTEGEDVGLDAGLARDELLRRHVGDRSTAGGVGGAGGRRGVLAGGTGRVKVGLVGGEAPGEAEVEDLDQAAVGQHDVGGLQVAMEDSQVVRSGETFRYLDTGRQNELEGGRTLGDELVEALSGNVLHDDVRLFGLASFGRGLSYVIDGADVRVVDRGGKASLAELRRPHLLDGQVAALEQLEDDRPLQQGVVGEVHDSAAARADLTDEFILLD